MSDLFVIVHTDAHGEPWTLGGVIYTSLPVAEARAAERRRTAEEQSWPDRYDVYRLVSVEDSAPVAAPRMDPKPLADRLARFLDERRTVPSELAHALRCALSVCAQESRVAEIGLGMGQSLTTDMCNHGTLMMADRVIRAITDGLDGLQAALDRIPAGVDPLLLDLLDDLADVDDCRIEADGHCEAHGWYAVEQTCPQARVKRVLAEAGLER